MRHAPIAAPPDPRSFRSEEELLALERARITAAVRTAGARMHVAAARALDPTCWVRSHPFGTLMFVFAVGITGGANRTGASDASPISRRHRWDELLRTPGRTWLQWTSTFASNLLLALQRGTFRTVASHLLSAAAPHTPTMNGPALNCTPHSNPNKTNTAQD